MAKEVIHSNMSLVCWRSQRSDSWPSIHGTEQNIWGCLQLSGRYLALYVVPGIFSKRLQADPDIPQR